METRRQDRDILSHQFRGQQGGGTSTHVAPCHGVREISSCKNKEYKKQNLLYDREIETQTEKTLQKFMDFYLVMLHFAEWSKAQQWIVA